MWSRLHKARGQGQGQKKKNPRPRTGMLEAKNQGHRRKCSPKKKGFQEDFSSDFKKNKKKKGLEKIFSGDLQRRKTKKVFAKFSARFLAFSYQILTVQKNSAVLEQRTEQFSRTWGFNPKTKDLIFEAKTKDFKMCPRSQGRPRGLHLCWWHFNFAPPPPGHAYDEVGS